jgi:hypothetical protein
MIRRRKPSYKDSTALMIMGAKDRARGRHNWYSGVDSRTKDYKNLHKERRGKIAKMMKSHKKIGGHSLVRQHMASGVYNI